MNCEWKCIVGITGIVALTLVGDYFLKLASLERNPFHNRWFAMGCGIYALGAFGWVLAMRSMKLAVAGTVYSATTVLLLSILGALVFDERLTRSEIAGVGAAVLSIVLLVGRN